MTGRALLALCSIAVSLPALAAAAAQSPPAQQFPIGPNGGGARVNGFVEVIHANGPEVFAHHVYELKGADSDQAYQVVVSIWTSNTTCSGAAALRIPVALVVTNASGNGNADVVFDPETVAALGILGLTIGGEVAFHRDGLAEYTTGCQVMRLD
jgi:hypothetical protein